ncbi:hypothetical protein SERLADRAFT_359843 [Serpula lacrymans var. lacrymans S7.9]|uniref:non-specific serine/threonine protein kinase n=1 Tax=Serpula lacrymans var. lacrymans (strain S7.9) TaxID=578457 RepID=F8NL06_SERL9|nr:uncharacterized protein SERLADRAFT_359843 [Serpula lacrymans var. lacrymans S7.9]EGO28514.1 hypothetical protein SERLADRAFT_359843 [Serpula lacrymans var. lacrymans S7.9]
MAPKEKCAKYQYVVTSSGPQIVPVPDQESKEEESPADYNAGGYLPIKINDSFKHARYTVVRKLGWGHFSTVWLVKDAHQRRHSALKVVKSAGRYSETARDEIKLLSQVAAANPLHPGRSHIVSFFDSFDHPAPNDLHVCIVFEPLGENLLALIERNKKKGVPPPFVKIISKQILLGLQYLHDECDLVHTDIKPENILISIPDIESHINTELSLSSSPTSRRRRIIGRERHVQIFDSQPLSSPSSRSGSISASASRHNLKMSVPSIISLGQSFTSCSANQPSEPLSPSILSSSSSLVSTPPTSVGLSSPSSSSPSTTPNANPTSTHLPITVKIADLGNATPSRKHYTEDIQTRQYRAPEAILGRKDWGTRVDIWSVACLIFELLTAEYLFDPHGQGELFTKDDDHMAQIMELMGDFPMEAKMDGKYSRELFDHSGSLRYIKTLKPWPLNRVMTEKYLFSSAESAELCAFLEPMLAVDQRDRKEARDVVGHPWLEVKDEEWVGLEDW